MLTYQTVFWAYQTVAKNSAVLTSNTRSTRFTIMAMPLAASKRAGFDDKQEVKL
jgi:hypothetical protein